MAGNGRSAASSGPIIPTEEIPGGSLRSPLYYRNRDATLCIKVRYMYYAYCIVVMYDILIILYNSSYDSKIHNYHLRYEREDRRQYNNNMKPTNK